MPTILSIEKSTELCSVAIHRDGKLIEYRVIRETRAHSRKLSSLVDHVINATGLSFGELDALAISKGPGSYTGLRVGYSLVKGLCFANDLQLIAIPTLQILANELVSTNSINPGDNIIPMLDARRMEVFTATYNAELKMTVDTSAVILDEASFEEQLANPCYFVGDGAPKFKKVCKHPNAIFPEVSFPNAVYMGNLAALKYKKGEFENVAYCEPYYLKEFVATKSKKLLKTRS